MIQINIWLLNQILLNILIKLMRAQRAMGDRLKNQCNNKLSICFIQQ